jgi:hypothetical protein
LPSASTSRPQTVLFVLLATPPVIAIGSHVVEEL